MQVTADEMVHFVRFLARQLAKILGVELLRERSRVREIGEEHGDVLALAAGGGFRGFIRFLFLNQGMPAAVAEIAVRRVTGEVA